MDNDHSESSLTAKKAVEDVENPSETFSLDSEGPTARFSSKSHKQSAEFLYNAFKTGVLGSGPAERDEQHSSLVSLIFKTIPWSFLLIQLLWSTCVLGFAYALTPKNDDGTNKFSSLSNDFWTSKLTVSTSVSYGVGWALFVLLGFFVREANGRYKEGQFSIEKAMSSARQLLRHLRQLYDDGTWHPGDSDRIAAHFVAFPIALKMTLRGERERAQLEPILDPDDVSDVLNTDLMYTQCTRVIRAYITAAEQDSNFSFSHSAKTDTIGCRGSRSLIVKLVDAMDISANAAVRIAHFRPSLGYINHLRSFLYIWSFFLPLVLIKTSGWFMLLWSLIISYCVAMLFEIAEALSKPFGFDIQDIKLNRICAQWGYQLLLEYSIYRYSMKDTVLLEHATPEWLEKPCVKNDSSSKKQNAVRQRMKLVYKGVSGNLGSFFMLKALTLFIAWLCFLVFLTWGLALNGRIPRLESDRWWSTYIPLSTDITGFMSLGVFLLLGFWMNEAYGRYWECLQIWSTKFKPFIEGVAFLLAVTHKKGFWHERDRECLLSFFVALSYAMKLHLRKSRDVSELEGILDPRDLQALAQAPTLPGYCLNVIFGYIKSAECLAPGLVQCREQQYGESNFNMLYRLADLEELLSVCEAMRKYPISPSFTAHLCVFVTFWLALLPVSLVKENGFFTFLFLIPVAYAIINLVSIGNNLSDPFGFDAEDIPMDIICDGVKSEIHHMYHETRLGLEGYVREEPYDRARLAPGMLSNISSSIDEDGDESVKEEKLKAHKEDKKIEDSGYTLQMYFRSIFDYLPDVSVRAQVCATVWSVAAVLASYFLSKIDSAWHSGLRGDCHEWCSPIDVDGDTLANIGYALFMLLSFRASDAIGRYENGAKLVYDLKLQLHSNIVEFVYTARQDYLHPKDRERFVAHLVQVPLLIRDRLLDGSTFNPISDDTLLSHNDQRRLAESHDPFEYLLRTLQSYGILLDKPTREPFTSEPLLIGDPDPLYILRRFLIIRESYAKMLSVKMFPVMSRYSNHQYLFTSLWLGLLPLYMTRQTGFFTILWAPLISYGVFALQAIAEKLVDPFGDDSIDIPVKKLLTETAEELLATVHSLDWDCYKNTRASPIETDPSIGARLTGGEVSTRRQFAYFEDHRASVENFGQSKIIEFSSTDAPKAKPNLLVHLVRSVPWWTLAGIVSWTAVGCVISYISRDVDAAHVRWWKSGISVAKNVSTYVSFPTFMLLGFYVQAAFRRYTEAGAVWGDNLRAACHSLATLMLNFTKEGCFHEKDHDRILGHIAAIPLVLKLELRQSRDLRELKGLLSYNDITRIQMASSMTTHCVDVIRAYMHEFNQHSERMEKLPEPISGKMTRVKGEVAELQNALRSARFLNEFDIAPGLFTLLNSLLGIWFLFLPFVLAELSGWFSILWVAIIAYGVLGMYAVAAELQSPFGLDVNDLDLDKIADFIVRDVLFVQKNYKAGLGAFVRRTEIVDLWKADTSIEKKRVSSFVDNDEPKLKRIKEGMMLALKTVSPLQMIFTVVWATLAVALSYGTSKWFKIDEKACSTTWFCTYIAVDRSLQGFIGFALFLLLGFRLYDSHARYVAAIRLWQDGILGLSRMFITRILIAYPPGTFHEGDLERICGHLVAFTICSMGALRGKDYREQLERVVSAEDVERILSAQDRIDYCMDVIRAYLLESNWMKVRKPGSEPPGIKETLRLQFMVRQVPESAYECRQLVRIPLPFGYVQHLKIFLYIWLLLLPLSLVETTGWVTIFWVVFIAYGVLGVEHWSDELADPFGHDISDVPLDEMCDRVTAEVKDSLTLIRGRGVAVWIHPNRQGFLSEESS